MGRPIGPRKVHRYSVEFKLTAVKFSCMPGVQVQTVADALEIHPLMLSRWRKETRHSVLSLLKYNSYCKVSGTVAAAAEAVSTPIWNQIWNQTAPNNQIDWWAVKD